MADMTVLQSVKRWLPQTQKWLHRQVTSLPEAIETKVACRKTMNLGEFRVPRIGVFLDDETGVEPVDWLLNLAGQTVGVERLVERWEIRRWVDWRSEFGADADIVHSHFGKVGWWDLEVVERVGASHVTSRLNR